MFRNLIGLMILLGICVSTFGEYKLQSQHLDPNAVTKGYFGYSVDIDGNTAIVGAKHYNSPGHAYIYNYDGFEWNNIVELSAPNSTGTDNYGSTVAICDNVAVVGSIDYDSNGVAFVYEYNGSQWGLVETLRANDAASGDDFGCAVDVDSNTIVVGARYKDNDKGAAYVFEKDNSVWTQQQKLIASDGNDSSVHFDGDQLGNSVSISGNRIVVGAKYYCTTVQRVGAAYVFEKSGGSWQQNETAKLMASDGNEKDWFGESVSIYADTIAVGAYYYIGNIGIGGRTGKVYIYDYNSTTSQWDEDTLVDPSPNSDALFGKSVSLDGGASLLVGAYLDKVSGVRTGTSYLFTRSQGQWDSGVEYVPSDLMVYEYFGASVAIYGDNMVVGAYKRDQDTGGDEKGAVYFFGYTPYSSDISVDGQVGFEDLQIMLDQWLSSPDLFSANVAPEPDGDGIIDLLDFSLLAQQWLSQ